jgi:hypothetical protein
MPTAYGDLALEALRAYALRGPQLTFLGHNDTITYPVETGGAQYLLRLHLPVVEAFAGERQSLRAIASELLWLEALGRERLPDPGSQAARLARRAPPTLRAL